MTDAVAEELEETSKPSKMPLILGLVAALIGGGVGFYISFSGIVFSPESKPEPKNIENETAVGQLAEVSYVPIEPTIISIGEPSEKRHLRFRAQLEVPKKYKSDVESVMPRVVDVLNDYLRAVSVEDLEKTTALTRIRSHMMHRIDIVTGKGRVRDLLIMEFVLN